MSKPIEMDAPCLGEAEKKYLSKAIDSGFVSSAGPFVPEFEAKVAAFLKVSSAVALQSGTAAIHMALVAAGIGPGDEVIVPSLTFAATVNPILYVGAVPVIVDVDPATWNIDPVKIKAALTKKTQAIIPVHVYGNPCAMDEIMGLAARHGFAVIEDATESLGAEFLGKPAGTFGDFGCLSFNGNKTITTGGGGMLVGQETQRLEHVRYLANQAKDKVQPGFHAEMGFNYRMTNIEAALGLAQCGNIEAFLARKRNFRKIYEKALLPVKGVGFQDKLDNAEPSCWLTCLRLPQAVPLGPLMEALRQKHIPTRRVFMPLPQMPYLKTYAKECPQAQDIFEHGLCLPSSTMNTEKDIEQAAEIIRKVIETCLPHGSPCVSTKTI